MPSKKKNKRKYKKENRQDGSTPATRDTNSPRFTFAPQPDCGLLQLPRELRDKVYDLLFVSTRVTFGERSTGRIRHKNMKPAAHSLALLRVCRQIFEETNSLWLGRVLFNFERVESLLDKLCSIPSNTLSQIRHVRTRGHTLMLSYEYSSHDVYHRLAWVLKLLPSLRLDTLTVLGSSSGIIDYDVLDGLVRHGNGWKELYYITKDSTMLGFKKMEMFMADPYWRRPQPSTWKEMLLSRDGADSQAAVTVYQATEEKAIGMAWPAIKRKHIELDGRYEDSDEEYFKEEKTFEVDAYHGANEYVWDDTVSF